MELKGLSPARLPELLSVIASNHGHCRNRLGGIRRKGWSCFVYIMEEGACFDSWEELVMTCGCRIMTYAYTHMHTYTCAHMTTAVSTVGGDMYCSFVDKGGARQIDHHVHVIL